jgi:hypothetical protein
VIEIGEARKITAGEAELEVCVRFFIGSVLVRHPFLDWATDLMCPKKSLYR